MRENENLTKYYSARINAINSKSRQKAANEMNIDLGRLLKIELGRTLAYPEEICKMEAEYNCPELKNYYCSHECPIGKQTVAYVGDAEIFKSSMQLFAALNKSDFIVKELVDILADGKITFDEEERIEKILRDLEEIIKQANAIKLANAFRKNNKKTK